MLARNPIYVRYFARRGVSPGSTFLPLSDLQFRAQVTATRLLHATLTSSEPFAWQLLSNDHDDMRHRAHLIWLADGRKAGRDTRSGSGAAAIGGAAARPAEERRQQRADRRSVAIANGVYEALALLRNKPQ